MKKKSAYTNTNDVFDVRLQVSMSQALKNEIVKMKHSTQSIADFIRESVSYRITNMQEHSEKHAARSAQVMEQIHAIAKKHALSQKQPLQAVLEWERHIREDR